jgi:glycosyltransferase involved in cell wall biosynthesis
MTTMRLTAQGRSQVDDPAYAGEGAAQRIQLVKFLTTFGIGGTEKQVANLTMRMDRRAFDVSFACMNRWGEMIKEIEGRQGISVSEYPMESLYELNAFRQQWRFARALRRSHTQILHSYNFYANMFSLPAAKLAGVPCIVASIRDMGIYLSPMKLRAQKLVCRLADRVVVNAGAIRDWLIEQGYAPDKIVVIRNGVDTSRFIDRNDGAALRRELDIPAGAPLVVLLARLSPTKGIECFFEAAAKVREKHPDAYFLAVGECYKRDAEGEIVVDSEYRQRLQDKATSLGLADRVRFAGQRKDVPQVLAAAAVSVLPSISEGISNTLLESMAAGVPVVATRVGGTPEVIDDGEHGLLVPPNDARSLADAITRVLDDPALAVWLSANARRRVTEEFSFEAVVRKTEALYRELLAAKHRGP